MTDSRTVIAVNRFGLGARPGEIARADADPRGWLLAQLGQAAPLPEALQDLPSAAEALRAVQQRQEELQRLRKTAGAPGSATQKAFRSAKQLWARQTRDRYLKQAAARIAVAASTERPFAERLTHFWANHFAVSADKEITRTLAATLEAEAIRPHVAGRFEDMLLAVEQHPAMITYLDNQASFGPGAKAAKWIKERRGKVLGLNENLAREILELHTLGVNGGYTQADVTTFAHVITGWTVAQDRGRFKKHGRPGHFVFIEELHEPGAKTLLGKRYEAGGLGQGEAVLRDLAAHPSTARHIAMKLTRHFVADTPPPAVVERVARAFEDSSGHLPAVYAALVGSPEAWIDPLPKLKTPQDFVVSTFRALDHVPDGPEPAVAALRILGQLPYMPGSPAGWPDTQADWGGSDALMSRIEWASAVGERVGSRANPALIARASLGPFLGRHTAIAIDRASSAEQALTLFLVSPEFQRR